MSQPPCSSQFHSVSELLEELEDRGLPEMDSDQRSGGYVIRSLRREE